MEILLRQVVHRARKARGAVDFAIETLGLRHPNDATLKMLIAIVLLCHGTELSPDDFYEKLGEVKDITHECLEITKSPEFSLSPTTLNYNCYF